MRYCGLNPADEQFLSQTIDSLGLSARAYHRILKLARTIADMVNSEVITRAHLQEAIGYRRGKMML